MYLRLVLEAPLMGFWRRLIDYRHYRAAQKILETASTRFGWRILPEDLLRTIKKQKKADTLYILGSGSSINSLNEGMWKKVGSQVSVGINHWTLHQFVPSIYAIETIPDARIELSGTIPRRKINHLNHLRLLGRREVLESDAKVICLAPRTERENSQLMELPREMRERTYIYYRFTPVTRSRDNILSDFRSGLDFGGAEPSGVVVPDSGATLVRLLGLALRAGFSQVVLLGVDLSTKYFWEEPDSKLFDSDLMEFEQPMSGGVHETLLRNHRPFTVVEVVREIAQLYVEKGSIIRFDYSSPKFSGRT